MPSQWRTQYSFASLSPDVRSIYTVLAVDHILYAVLAIEHILYAVLAAHIYANLPREYGTRSSSFSKSLAQASTCMQTKRPAFVA